VMVNEENRQLLLRIARSYDRLAANAPDAETNKGDRDKR
jgi:hypothetical protein